MLQYILQLEINNKMATRYFSVRIKEDIANAVLMEVKRNKISASQIFNIALRDYFFNRDERIARLMDTIDETKRVVGELDNASKRVKKRE